MFASLIVANTAHDISMIIVDLLLLGVFVAFIVAAIMARRHKQSSMEKTLILPPWAITIGTLCVMINLLYQLRGI